RAKNPDFCRDFSLMQVILFDDETRFRLLPFTHTRPVADIRCGILTMRERWEYWLRTKTSTITDSYLQPVFPIEKENDHLLVNASVFANEDLTNQITNLKEGEKLLSGELLIAARLGNAELHFHNISAQTANLSAKNYAGEVKKLQHIWDIFSLNEKAIAEDFQLQTKGKRSEPIPEYV